MAGTPNAINMNTTKTPATMPETTSDSLKKVEKAAEKDCFLIPSITAAEMIPNPEKNGKYNCSYGNYYVYQTRDTKRNGQNDH